MSLSCPWRYPWSGFCACQMFCAFASQRRRSKTWVYLECCDDEICVPSGIFPWTWMNLLCLGAELWRYTAWPLCASVSGCSSRTFTSAPNTPLISLLSISTCWFGCFQGTVRTLASLGALSTKTSPISYSGDFWELPGASAMRGKVPKVRLAVGIVLGFGMFSWVSQSGVHPDRFSVQDGCEGGWGKQRQRLPIYCLTLEISISKQI